jgi:hypothetical protein
MGIPSPGNGFQALNNCLHVLQITASQRPPLENPLDRLGHVEPTAPKGVKIGKIPWWKHQMSQSGFL